MNEIKDDNKFLVGILVLGLVCVIAWFCHDIARNKPTYESTNNGMEDVEKRIDRIESRLADLQGRIEQSEKTITGIADRIKSSTNLAESVATGIQGTEDRIDQAIQRSGRIANIIAEIERKNK